MTALFGSTVADWDSITIGAWFFGPTKITFSGDIESKLDVAPAPGTDGARETPLGYLPAKLDIAIVLYSDDMFATWAAMLSQIKPKPGKTTMSSVTISHPLLRMNALPSYYRVPKITIAKPIGPQMYEGRLSVVEHFDRPKAAGTQTATIASQPSIFDGSNRATPTDPQTDNTGP